MLSIDINCDMGEGFPDDEGLMSYISSANIACGVHAGSIDIMRRTIELALRHDIAVGAHPSYPDRANFGRIDQIGSGLNLKDLPVIIFDQVTQIGKICSEYGTQLHHLKPHGALYNRAARDPWVSSCICKAVADWSPSLILYGLSGSEMEKQAGCHHIKFVQEAFADRTYREDGSLTPRNQPNALIEDVHEAAERVLQMLRRGTVTTTSGKEIFIKTGTICIHGDGGHALEFAKSVRDTLYRNGIAIMRPAFG
jgi:UPF0271 protein